MLLASAATLVKPGGLLVYSTCSLETEENDAPIDRFLAIARRLEARTAADGAVPARCWIAAGCACCPSGTAPMARSRHGSGERHDGTHEVAASLALPRRLRRRLRAGVDARGRIHLSAGRRARRSKVPNVIGLSFDVASQRLQQAGFKAQRGEMRYENAAPRMSVLQDDPRQGTTHRWAP